MIPCDDEENEQGFVATVPPSKVESEVEDVEGKDDDHTTEVSLTDNDQTVRKYVEKDQEERSGKR